MYSHSVHVNKLRRLQLGVIYSEIADIIDRNEHSKDLSLPENVRLCEAYNRDKFLSEASMELYLLVEHFDEEVPSPTMLDARAVQYERINSVVRVEIVFIEGLPEMDQIKIHVSDRTISYYDRTYYSDIRNDPRILPLVPLIQDGKHHWFFYLYTEDQKVT